MFIRHFFAHQFYLLFYIVADGPDLSAVGSLANDEEIGRSFGYFSQVQTHNVSSLLVLYGFNVVLKIFELRESLVTVFFLRLFKTESGSNNY